jgi:hypothetical protein
MLLSGSRDSGTVCRSKARNHGCKVTGQQSYRVANKDRHSLENGLRGTWLRHPTIQRIFGRVEEARGAGPTLGPPLTRSPDPTGAPNQPKRGGSSKAPRDDVFLVPRETGKQRKGQRYVYEGLERERALVWAGAMHLVRGGVWPNGPQWLSESR